MAGSRRTYDVVDLIIWCAEHGYPNVANTLFHEVEVMGHAVAGERDSRYYHIGEVLYQMFRWAHLPEFKTEQGSSTTWSDLHAEIMDYEEAAENPITIQDLIDWLKKECFHEQAGCLYLMNARGELKHHRSTKLSTLLKEAFDWYGVNARRFDWRKAHLKLERQEHQEELLKLDKESRP